MTRSAKSTKPRLPKNRRVYIYALCDPDTDEVMYVGKTVQSLAVRLSQHIHSTQYYSTRRVVNWLSDIVDQDKIPKMIVLETTDEVHWEQAEIKWIAYYRRINPRLTNQHQGGVVHRRYYSNHGRKPRKRR